MTIEQLRVGDNFSYVIYCQKTKKAALVDPSYNASKALEFITKNELDLKYLINTHHHSDHTTANQNVKAAHACELVVSSSASSFTSDGVDKPVADGELLKLGEVTLKFIHTPGHTPDGLSIVVDDEAILTGDTMFIGDCGRCDLPGSSLAEMFHSLHEKIGTLPDPLIVYPGHDYGDKPHDTLGNQKKTNRTLVVKSLEEFSKIP